MFCHRSLLLATVLSCLSALPAAADTDIHMEFAVCTGRLSAQLEYERARNSPDADLTETQLTHFRDLMEATAVTADWRDSVDLRIRAKLAHKAILIRAFENENHIDARWARKRLDTHLTACQHWLPTE